MLILHALLLCRSEAVLATKSLEGKVNANALW